MADVTPRSALTAHVKDAGATLWLWRRTKHDADRLRRFAGRLRPLALLVHAEPHAVSKARELGWIV